MNLFNYIKYHFKKNSLRKIKLIVFDVDGVLTDGSLFYGDDGLKLKSFNSKDGLGIKILQNIGVDIAIISGGKTIGAESRCKDLGIQEYSFQVKNKAKYIEKLQQKMNYKKDETAFMGDDLNDIVVKSFVKLFICPKDAHFLVKKASDMILSKQGGMGCVRELSDLIFRSKFNESINKKLIENIKKTLVA